jgi:hypothetical protein
MKIKPGVERLNENDYFNLLVNLTTGGARDQATALERELIADLAKCNAAARRKYERDLAEYARQMLLWNARAPPKEPSSKDKEAEPPKPHRKKPRLPGICRTRAGLDLYCRPYGGRCQTRTDTCRPAPCQPSGSKFVPVWYWPVLDQTGRPTRRQDRLPDRHMLRHCYSGRSQAGTNDLYL